jgi:hypothetical protein
MGGFIDCVFRRRVANTEAEGKPWNRCLKVRGGGKKRISANCEFFSITLKFDKREDYCSYEF